MLRIHLKKGREKPVVNGHPWIFSGAIARCEGDAGPGEPCEVVGAGGAVLGYGYYNAKSSITVRMLTKGKLPFSVQLLRGRIETALRSRETLLADKNATDSCRLVNAEGDFLPGLIVDKYADGLSVQLLTAGMERLRADIIAALADLLSPAFIFERSDTEARQREGLAAQDGLLQGALPQNLVIKENGLSIGVDIAAGQKTGFFFDQRPNRMLIRHYVRGRRCLDCFSYSGGFGLNMLAGGAASVTAVDTSKSAEAWFRQNRELNEFAGVNAQSRCADVFEYLRSDIDTCDCIVLDPPKFAKHPSEVLRAARGYKDINLLAMKKILPDGIIFTFSCSNAVDAKLFRQIVFAAAADANRQIQVLHILSAGPDHPVNIAHPEGEYLKGIVVRVE